MNVKEGDLAIALGHGGVEHDALVRVVRRVDVVFDGVLYHWECESLQTIVCGVTGKIWPAGTLGHAQDRRLRPLRDGQGDDETLTWAGKPSDIQAPVAA